VHPEPDDLRGAGRTTDTIVTRVVGDRRDSISRQSSRSVTYPGSGHAHVSAQLLHGLLGLITTSNIRI
jgi:hypothetical protein